MLPDRINLNGRYYVAEDALPEPSSPPERDMGQWVPVKQLCAEYGIDPHKAYDAIRDGLLEARRPNGMKRGLRCRRGDFVRWMEETWLVRC